MLMTELKYEIDVDHEKRAQTPNPIGTPYRHRLREKELHIMATENAALARAAELKAKGKKSAPAKKSTVRKPREAKSDIPWAKIAKMYEAGKSTAEISDALDLTRRKTQDGKENPYPYYLVVGYLTKLSHGVEVNGETIKIKRGNRSSKKDKK